MSMLLTMIVALAVTAIVFVGLLFLISELSFRAEWRAKFGTEYHAVVALPGNSEAPSTILKTKG
jgi:hypothetical protein